MLDRSIPNTVLRWTKWCVVAIVAKVTLQIVATYDDYFPPNFQSDFLLGRENHFDGWYRTAFYLHITTSPLAMLACLFLLHRRTRLCWPSLHRWLGRAYVCCVLGCVVPSGMVMASRAQTGAVAGTGFIALAIMTAFVTLMGWRRAVQRSFHVHQQWMTRSFLMLSSAIVLRLIAGLTIVIGFEANWVYPLSAWISWSVPLLIHEYFLRNQMKPSVV